MSRPYILEVDIDRSSLEIGRETQTRPCKQARAPALVWISLKIKGQSFLLLDFRSLMGRSVTLLYYFIYYYYIHSEHGSSVICPHYNRGNNMSFQIFF